MVGDVVDTETVGAGDLKMLDKLNAYAYVPSHLAGLCLQRIDRVLVELESECRTGQHVGSDDLADEGEADLIFEVKWNFEEVLVVCHVFTLSRSHVDVGVHAGVHCGEVEADADDGHLELCHDAESVAATIVVVNCHQDWRDEGC